MCKNRISLFLFVVLATVFAFRANAGLEAASPCSSSPVEPLACESVDHQYQIDFYDTRAHMQDNWDGLDNYVFCAEGYLKVNGQQADAKEIVVQKSISAEALVMQTPNGDKVTVTGYVQILFSPEFEGKAGAFGASVLFKDKTATMYLLALPKAGEGAPVVKSVELSCH